MSASKLQESREVRIEHSLNKSEEEFVVKRRKAVLQSLQKLQINCSEDEMPNIALLGSGGGERAMVGLLGSLVQLQKTGLLDCILYLSGISGSTWCMASLYQESDWSTKLETVKDKIIHRLSGSGVSWEDAFAKLNKYYNGKDYFSLTDVWAVILVTEYVKEIDEHTLTDHWDQESKDPFPIYAVIDKHSKQRHEGDPWFEITPYEAGYSLTGAFVDTSDFGSRFDNGHKVKDQPEIDMLYLQALCGSAVADDVENQKFLLERINEYFHHSLLQKDPVMFEDMSKEDEYHLVLKDLVNMNLYVLHGKDASALDESIRAKLNELTGEEQELVFPKRKLSLSDRDSAKQYMNQYTMDVCHHLSQSPTFLEFTGCIKSPLAPTIEVFIRPMAQKNLLDLLKKRQLKRIWTKTLTCISRWIWGRNYGFLHNMKDEALPAALLKSETRDYEDAGVLLNSPFFSVLRKERNVDLIISLDFSDDDRDYFKTVKDAAEMCRKRKIPFPEVIIPSEDVKKPKDFYVFKGPNAPTVIHIPLFNVVNCGDKIQTYHKKYQVLQGPYSAEMMMDLMEVAGRNITNNTDNLLEQIRMAIKHK